MHIANQPLPLHRSLSLHMHTTNQNHLTKVHNMNRKKRSLIDVIKCIIKFVTCKRVQTRLCSKELKPKRLGEKNNNNNNNNPIFRDGWHVKHQATCQIRYGKAFFVTKPHDLCLVCKQSSHTLFSYPCGYGLEC